MYMSLDILIWAHYNMQKAIKINFKENKVNFVTCKAVICSNNLHHAFSFLFYFMWDNIFIITKLTLPKIKFTYHQYIIYYHY